MSQSAPQLDDPLARLCLGGTFNPIHMGHLLCARAAAETLGIKTVVLIPARVSPHKTTDPAIASAQDRLAMCRLAIQDTAGFEIDDRELGRAGPSFTIDTVRQLLSEGWPQVPWLLGADQVLSLPTWHQPHELLRQARLIVMARPGWVLDWNQLPPEFAVLAQHQVPVPAMDISATQIRRRVSAGLSIDFLTPPGVCRFIRERGLYQK